jgi:hypothetical protein
MYDRAVAKPIIRVSDAEAASDFASVLSDRDRRRAFIEELCQDMAVYPLTLEIAQLAGRWKASKPRAESAWCLKNF